MNPLQNQVVNQVINQMVCHRPLEDEVRHQTLEQVENLVWAQVRDYIWIPVDDQVLRSVAPLLQHRFLQHRSRYPV